MMVAPDVEVCVVMYIVPSTAGGVSLPSGSCTEGWLSRAADCIG